MQRGERLRASTARGCGSHFGQACAKRAIAGITVARLGVAVLPATPRQGAAFPATGWRCPAQDGAKPEAIGSPVAIHVARLPAVAVVADFTPVAVRFEIVVEEVHGELHCALCGRNGGTREERRREDGVELFHWNPDALSRSASFLCVW